ncbi:hypothetical protein [uncultured Methylobacterium sp.]|uniref:hypothetical protein n=1 Tax=uncultured Methylobacterium sp. TaxID=157278 RepID=UPI0035CB8C14
MSWQPMTSAPRDGQRFVAGLWVGQGAAARFEMHIIRADLRGEGVHPGDDRGWAWADYTHWMALPIPLSPTTKAVQDTRRSKATVPPMHKAYGLE